MKTNVQEIKFVHYKMLENKIKVKKFDIISLFLILIFFGIDRISKISVIKKIQSEQGDIFLNDFINITLNWNQGIAFRLFSLDTSFLYHLISAIILIIIVYLVYLMVISDNTGKIIVSFILGGAVGNVYDRLINSAVPDFIDFHYHSFHWFIFNVADIFITTGVLLLIYIELVLKNKKS